MKMRARQLQQLEARRLMAADADVILDMWPGPLHGDPTEIGKYETDDGTLTFKAATPDGEQWFKTDGTLEGTVPFTPPEPVYPIREDSYEPYDSLRILHTVNYSDPDGRHLTWQNLDYCGEGVTFEDCVANPRTMDNIGISSDTFGPYLSVSETVNEESRYFLARGTQDQWLELPPGFHEIVVVDASVIVTIDKDTGPDTLTDLQSDFQLEGVVGFKASGLFVATEAYVATDSEIGVVTTGPTYTPLIDLTAFEFPTEFRSFDQFTNTGLVVTLWDPVYELRSYHVRPNGDVQPMPLPHPSDASLRIGHIGEYELVDGYATRDNVTFYAVELPPVKLWSVGDRAIAFQDKDSIDTGRELTVRHLMAGDVNLDGFFDSSDLIELMARGEYEDGIVGNSHHLTGDFNGDGEFDTSDLITALAEGRYRA
jgi:hypothetical protein